MTVTLHIEHLVIDGLPAGAPERSGLKETVEQELTALLTQASPDGWAAATHATLRLHDVRPVTRPLGQQIAHSTVQALRPNKE